MQREKYIDIAKGIGILMVIFCHVIKCFDITPLNIISQFCYSFHMPLFFFITGYCLGLRNDTGEKPKLISNIKKISASLILPYFVWSFIYLFLDGNLFKSERLVAIFTTRGIAPIWFLATLFCCQVFFHLLKALTCKMKSRSVSIIFAVASIVCLSTAYLMHLIKGENNLSADTIGTTLYYLYVAAGRFFISVPVLFGGYLFSKGKVLSKLRKIPSLVLGTALVVAVYFAVEFANLKTNIHLFDSSNFPLLIFTSFAGAMGILMISYALPSVTGVVSLIGVNSLYFMLLHYIPFKTMAVSSQVFDFTENPVIYWILTSIGTVLITAAGTWVLKRGFFLGKKIKSK